MFPAEVGGWQKRQLVSGIDPIDLREVPLRMGFDTGIPGAPMSAAGVLALPVAGLPPNGQPNRKGAGIVSLADRYKGNAGHRRFLAGDPTPRLKSA